MTFEEVWDGVEEGTTIKVSTGRPPPSTNTEGLPYKIWFSNNFTGILEEKLEKTGWRYLKFEVSPELTGDEMQYLAYDIPEGEGHNFLTVE